MLLGAESRAILRRLALTLVRQEITASCGIKHRRLNAARAEDCLLAVLSSA